MQSPTTTNYAWLKLQPALCYYQTSSLLLGSPLREKKAHPPKTPSQRCLQVSFLGLSVLPEAQSLGEGLRGSPCLDPFWLLVLRALFPLSGKPQFTGKKPRAGSSVAYPLAERAIGSWDAEPSANLGLPDSCDSDRTCSGHLGRSSLQASLQVVPALKLPALALKQPPAF